MAGGDDHRQPAFAVRPGREPVVEHRRHEDADVGAALGHRRLHVRAGLVFQADADLRMCLREGDEIARQALGDRTGVGHQAQMALDAPRELDHFAFQRMQRGIERADVAHQRAAGIGGLDAACTALEQRDAQTRLEVRHALARGGERQVLALRPARNAARLGNGKHEVEGHEVEAHE